jgi:phage portal protein BeeE
MLLGIAGDATYANYTEANRAFFRLTVLPLATRVVSVLGEWLSRYSGEVLDLKPDLDQVPALSSERDNQWKRVSEAAFLSDGEKRALLGLPKLNEGSDDADE